LKSLVVALSEDCVLARRFDVAENHAAKRHLIGTSQK